MEIQDKFSTFEPLDVHPVLSLPKVEGSYEETAEATHVAIWRNQNMFLDIPTRTIDVSPDSVKIKMPPMPKRVNFKLTPTSLDLKPCESPGPSSVRGRSSLKNLLPKLGSLYRTSSDIGKASCTSDLPFPTQEKTSIPRSASLTKIFTPRIGRTSSLPVTTNENPESAFTRAKGTQIHEAKVHICRSHSDPFNKERPIRSIDSFIRVIPSPRVPRVKAGDLQILNTNEPQKTDDVEADSEDIPEEDAVCRICMVELCEDRETLKMECSCKGELALAHQDCAVKWFSIKGNRMCDVCKHEVQNLPVTLLRIQSTRATNSAATRVQSININDYRAWQEVPVLVIVSMLAYFCFLEQLLVAKMGTGAITISLPFSCLLGLLSSMTSSTMVSKRFVWVYASMQFALVVIFGHIFYTLVHIQAIISLMLATFIGYGIAMSVSSIVVLCFRWRRRNSQPRAQQDSQVALSINQQEENSLCFSWLGFINHRSTDAENP